ncbi:ribonuclease P protein component [Wenyingzhuangia sp. 2_MG-2023]|uniref:ribonuclease P protein component n=1 Tax=Wenyingzhuangia sp. 2_MG-2023 TaxID=3062639 RepID=UPI0026E2C9D4|nr:ribonuclease P protein component [Wenyingzhuangia sp. 2_MG-2023]MDO6736563.1 ribonuclease P protein component [Wenyingzhuangia sp. 2_MG-2023]
MKFTLGKNQKLKSRKAIAQLFIEGKSVKDFPIKMIYIPVEASENAMTKVAFSVPKRNFKLAVDRNRIKRLLREAYRLHQHDFFKDDTQSYHIMFIYMGNKIPNYEEVESRLKKLFFKFKSLHTSLPS